MIIELEGKVLQTENEDFWVAPDANVIKGVVKPKVLLLEYLLISSIPLTMFPH